VSPAVCRTREEVAHAVSTLRAQGRPVALVPTMGALHAGHAALVRRARRDGAEPVVSIFVNPLQFGPGEDFARYPRDEAGDLGVAAGAGASVVYLPAAGQLVPEPPRTVVAVPALMGRMDALSRPGHFEGVAMIVVRLLAHVAPDSAYFGEKDAQQLAVVRRVVRDLQLPVRIVGVATVREPDGLAMSSRNAYLPDRERTQALSLSRALRQGEARIAAGERDPATVADAMAQALAAAPGVTPEYAVAVDPDDLAAPDRLLGRTLLAVAARVGPARLIDNLRLWVPVLGVPTPLVDDPDGADAAQRQARVQAQAEAAARRRRSAADLAFDAAAAHAVKGTPDVDPATLQALLDRIENGGD